MKSRSVFSWSAEPIGDALCLRHDGQSLFSLQSYWCPVEKPDCCVGKVWINQTQYFDAAPEISWHFYIGGYQPAQKWLKDRRGRVLGIDDIRHYQRILKLLSETARIMQTITMTLTV